jgi:hypothetical protein
MRKKKINPDRYYIVNLTDLQNIFIYHHGYEKKNLAQASQKYYCQEGVFGIYKGTKAMLYGLPIKKAEFKKYLPSVERTGNPALRILQKTGKGTGLRAYKFKKLWEPLPLDREERRIQVKGGRDSVRRKILK